MLEKKQTAFVIAHYHEKGVVAKDTINLITAMQEYSSQIIFVSTNLTDEFALEISKIAEVIVRQNTGYDFYSYKLGIEMLGDLRGFKKITLLNSSFVCINPKSLLSQMMTPVGECRLMGITKSFEISEHIQSYWVGFEGSKLIQSSEFKAWWNNLQPLDERQDNINKYEIGMSSYFARKGYPLHQALTLTKQNLFVIFCRAVTSGYFQPQIEDGGANILINLESVKALNPTIFAWDFIAERLGVIKIELLKKNYAKLDLSSKISEFSNDQVALINNALS